MNVQTKPEDAAAIVAELGRRAKTAAVALHRNRGSNGFDELVADAREAGRIAGVARTQIEQGSARKPKRVA